MATNKAPQLNSMSQCIHQYTPNTHEQILTGKVCFILCKTMDIFQISISC